MSPTQRPVFVGIDGGGTRSSAVVTDHDGHELGRLETGPTLVNDADPAGRASALADLIDHALRAANAKPPVEAVCCALAGGGRKDTQRELSAAILKEAIAFRVRIVTDAEAAFYDTFGTGPGILLIAGTGSIAWGRGEDGALARVGGWGERLGDEGSAYAIGRDTLRAILRAHDGRGRPTALTETILTRLGLESPESLIAWSAHAEKYEVAALAPHTLEQAKDTEETGPADAMAREIIAHAADELAEHITTLEARLGPWNQPPHLALAGGLLTANHGFRTHLLDALERRGTAVRPLETRIDAARGAAGLARIIRQEVERTR